MKASLFLHFECKSGERDGVPVSWLFCNTSCSNFANRPNSAGMGPGVFKTQSKHTKNKSPYPTGIRKANLFLPIECKSGGKRDGVPVSRFWCNWRQSKLGPTKLWPSDRLSARYSSHGFSRPPALNGSRDSTNRSHSAGMGPGVYKNQSKHTKTSHPIYPTGTIG